KSEFEKGRFCIRNPVFIYENENFLDTLIKTLNRGEKVSIVKCIERGIMGYVNVNDLIKTFEKESYELSNK
ncbi:MAG: hypothetical protein H5U37_07515, partial [Caldisericia bacterium]|nr:hypothetical protein [Caldisericia bacterium]